MPESPVQSVSWVDLSGGGGLERIRGPQDMNRFYMANALTQRQGRIIVNPTGSATGSSTPLAGSDHYLGVLPTGTSNADELYAMGSDKIVYKLSTFATTWTAKSSALTSVPTDVCNVTLGGSYYMVFACNSANTVYSSDGTTWTDNAQDSLYVCAWDDKLWGITSAGQLWYTSDLSTFTNDALLPTGAGAVKALITANDAAGEQIIYALTTKGLFSHDFANSKFWRTNFKETTGTYYGKPVEWNGYICMPIDDVIHMYPTSGGNVIMTSPAFPDGHSGVDTDTGESVAFGPNVLSVVPLAGRLFALTGPSSGTGGRIISYFDGQAWHGFKTGSALWRRLFISYTASSHILWIPTLTAGSLVYVVIPSLTGVPASYEDAGRVILPWFDGFEPLISKVALRVHVETANMSTTETITINYALDYGVSKMVTLGKVSTDGLNSFNFPANTPIGMQFRAIRFVATMATSNGASSPRLLGLTFEWRSNALMET